MPDSPQQPYAAPSPYLTPAPYATSALPPAQPTPPAQPWAGPPVGPTPPPPRPSQAPLVLSVISLVTSGVALLVALVFAVWFFAPVDDSGAPYPDEVGDARYEEYIRGQIKVTDGAIAGSLLEMALERQIDLQDGYVDAMTCPDTPDVHQGSVTLCHGDVDGYDWTGIVIFEDADGTYFLDER